MPTTPRWGLEIPEETTAPPDVPVSIRTLAEQLDLRLTPSNIGLLEARPAAGRTGQRYYATDTRLEYLDIGASWITVGAIQNETITNELLRRETIRGEKIAPEGLTNELLRRETIRGEKIAPEGVRIENLNREMRPEAGAPSEAKALRALGAAAGTAAAGNDSRLSQGAPEVSTVRRIGAGAEECVAGTDSRLRVGRPNFATVRALGTGTEEAAPGNDERFRTALTSAWRSFGARNRILIPTEAGLGNYVDISSPGVTSGVIGSARAIQCAFDFEAEHWWIEGYRLQVRLNAILFCYGRANIEANTIVAGIYRVNGIGASGEITATEILATSTMLENRERRVAKETAVRGRGGGTWEPAREERREIFISVVTSAAMTREANAYVAAELQYKYA